MPSFKDATGRAWPVAIRVAEVKRCRAMLGVDLPALINDKLKPLEGLLSDPVKFVDVLYVCCEVEARERGVDDEAFGRLLGGDVLADAATAFVEALRDFFPDPALRMTLTIVIETGRAARAKLTQLAKDELSKIDVEKMLEASMSALLKQRVSSASTPMDSHSAN